MDHNEIFVVLLLTVAATRMVAFILWYRQHVNLKVIAGLQGLVDKMKEYDLDARAGLIICQDFDLHILYIDPALQNLLGCPTSVDELLPLSMRERHRQLVAPYVGHQALPASGSRHLMDMMDLYRYL